MDRRVEVGFPIFCWHVVLFLKVETGSVYCWAKEREYVGREGEGTVQPEVAEVRKGSWLAGKYGCSWKTRRTWTVFPQSPPRFCGRNHPEGEWSPAP